VTTPSDDRYIKGRALARAARRGPLASLYDDPNVAGMAYGRRTVRGTRTDEPAVVVYVLRKTPARFLPTSRMLPRRMYFGGDFVEIDVVETGPFHALAFTDRERPAPNGVSVAHVDVTAGTLGSLVADGADGSLNILSNNHVLADVNEGAPGDPILQPGPADGGTVTGDTIARLNRFVRLNATGNIVDAAIARVINPDDVVDRVKNDLIPVATPDHPAVGLLFAGSSTRTLVNPIDAVLNRLDVSFLHDGDVTADVDVGTNVEKVGRTTEYTTATVTEIDVSVSVDYGEHGVLRFDSQFATAHMSEPGDSGSLVYRGGTGGEDGSGGCPTTAALARLLGRDLSLDAAVERDFRERYLGRTRVGRFLIEAYFAYEDRAVARMRAARIDEDDRRFLQRLYDTYAETLRAVALQPNRADLVFTEEHLREIRRIVVRLREYFTAGAAGVVDEVLGIVAEFVGRTVPEILQALDDPDLLRRVTELARRAGYAPRTDAAGGEAGGG